MTIVILIARVIGAIYLISGIAVLLGKVKFKEIVWGLNNSIALRFITGCIGIAIGTIMVSFHNVWIAQWVVIITIVSWLFLVGGAVMILFPSLLKSSLKILPNNIILGISMLLFSLVFLYFGLVIPLI